MSSSKKKRGRTMMDILQSKSQPSGTQEYRQPSPVEESHSTEPGGSTSSESTSKKRCRGIARGIDTWGTGKKLELEFNELLQPDGDNTSLLATHLGIIARSGQRVPLHYAQWPDMPNDILEYIWKDVQDNTNAPLEYRSNCLKSVAYLWRRWKSFVKTNFYDIWDTNEERLAHRPSRVVREQWEILVEYWGTEKQKGISATNKQNCQSRELPHKTGRTPFAVVRRKMDKAGEKIDRISVFKKTRSRNGDGSLDRETADVVAVMENLRDKVPEAEQTPEFIDGVFTKVLGPDGHGCVRTYGLGPTRSTIFGKGNGASTSQFMSMREQIREEIMSELGPMLAIMEKKIREDVRAEILAEREKDALGGTGQTTINVPTSSSVHCNSSDVEKERSLDDEDLGEHECFKI